MRVVVLPADLTGCGTLRSIWPTHVVKAARPDWQIDLYRPGDLQVATHPQTGELQAIKGLPDPTSIDVFVTQRVGKNADYQFMRWLQDHGVAVVVDADDALWCIDRDNGAYRTWNNAETHWRWMDAAAESADLVTCTTGALAARYGRHGRVEVIPNRILGEAIQAPSVRRRLPPTLTIGWSGFVRTHPRDLTVVGDAVKTMVDKHQCAVRIIGDGVGVADAWGLDPHQVEVTGPQPMGKYHAALTSIDIALVPLAASPFNTAKSDLKAREFISMGVPTIATPTPANRALARVSPLLLASSPAEWARYLDELLTEQTVRTQWAMTGRAALWPERLDQHGEVWAKAWERAAARRKRLVA